MLRGSDLERGDGRDVAAERVNEAWVQRALLSPLQPHPQGQSVRRKDVDRGVDGERSERPVDVGEGRQSGDRGQELDEFGRRPLRAEVDPRQEDLDARLVPERRRERLGDGGAEEVARVVHAEGDVPCRATFELGDVLEREVLDDRALVDL